MRPSPAAAAGLAAIGVLAWLLQRTRALAARAAEAERAARAAERDARTALEQIQAADSKILHDLRSPLTVARGYAELIAGAADAPQIREDAAAVVREVNRAAQVAAGLHTRTQQAR